MMADDKNQNQTMENTFVYLMTNPDGSFKTDRIIISKSQSYPKIFTIKVIGSDLVNSFTPIFDLDYSKSVEPDKVSQIIGAVSIFRISQDVYSKIASNSDLSDMNVVLDSSKETYGIIKRFLLTNPENLTNTLNEVVAYVDTYVKTQLTKYEITDDNFVNDINIAMFLMLSGKQKLYQPGVTDFIINQSNNVIPQSQIVKPVVEPQRKGIFSFLHNKTSTNKQQVKSKPQKMAVDDELSLLDKKVGKPKSSSIIGSIFQTWKEDAWESQKTHQARVEQKNKEIAEKLELEKKKLEIIERKHKLEKDLSKTSDDSSNSSNDSNSSNNTSSNTEPEQD